MYLQQTKHDIFFTNDRLCVIQDLLRIFTSVWLISTWFETKSICKIFFFVFWGNSFAFFCFGCLTPYWFSLYSTVVHVFGLRLSRLLLHFLGVFSFLFCGNNLLVLTIGALLIKQLRNHCQIVGEHFRLFLSNGSAPPPPPQFFKLDYLKLEVLFNDV